MGLHKKDKTPVSIDVVFEDPQFMFVQVISNIKYNVNLTSLLSNDIKSLVLAKISAFNNTYLQGFKKTLFYSQLLNQIDSADPSIVSNNTEVKAIKTFTPTTNTIQNFNIDFGFEMETETGVVLNNAEYHYGHTIQSSPFTYNGIRSIIVDDTNGNLYIAKLVAGIAEIVSSVGTVDYVDGIVNISNLTVSAYEGSSIKIYARSKTKDFSSSKNIILSINDEDVNVSVTPVKI